MRDAPAPPPRPTPTVPLAAPAPSAYDYRYRLLTPEATRTELVFDDGIRTYVRFQNEPPPGVMFFEQDGQPVRATLLDHFVIIDGVHVGVLVRRRTNYSYAAPRDRLRVTAVRARRADGSAPVTDADLPAALATQRPIFLETEARRQGGGACGSLDSGES